MKSWFIETNRSKEPTRGNESDSQLLQPQTVRIKTIDCEKTKTKKRLER